ncbi:hypothetical protein KEM60_01804 [Austwickia sp. TVS 96-490-7B]|nr:hypothetical protein [Austwickia sp. TVS 96-490-7B]
MQIQEVAGWLHHNLGYANDAGSVALTITAPNHTVPLHYDGCEVLTLQLTGEKKWSVGRAYEVDWPDRALFLNSRDSGARDGNQPPKISLPANFYSINELDEFILTAGFGVALPRGWWHSTKAGNPNRTGVSAGLIFKIPSLSLAQRITPLIGDELSRIPNFRRPYLTGGKSRHGLLDGGDAASLIQVVSNIANSLCYETSIELSE